VVQDQAANFKVTLPEGWMGHSGRAITVYNYDSNLRGAEGFFSPGEVKVTIDYDELEPPDTFEQWLRTVIEGQTDPALDPGVPTPAVTAPEPSVLGAYPGVSYLITSSTTGLSVRLFMLPTDDGRVIIASVMPADSSAALEALAVLSTLEILPK
jgi:hypothetical protein